VLSACVPQCPLVEHGDADGRIDERLLAERRGDDDLFEDVVVRGKDIRTVQQQGRRSEQIQDDRLKASDVAHDLLPTPVLTGSGSTGSALSAQKRIAAISGPIQGHP